MSDDCAYPVAPLHQVARRITDGSHFSPTPREHGHLIANVKDMKAGAIDFSSCTRISASAYRELKATGCTIKNGNVLLSKDGTVGRVVVYTQDVEIGALSSICIIEPTDRLEAAFLGQALQSEGCIRQYDNFMSGSALRRLVLRDIRSIEVPLPQAKHQRAIAQVLDTVDTAIHETEAIIAKLKGVKQGLLDDLLRRGIDSNGELRLPQAEAPHLYKDSSLGWIPKEWTVESISRLTTNAVIGPFGSDLVAADYRAAGVPVVFVRDVKPDSFLWKSNVYVSARKAQVLAAHQVVPGDVVATKMGLPPCVAAVYPDYMPNGVVTADIVRLRPDLTKILPGWMSAFINAPAVVKQVEQITAGVTRPKVTLRDARNLCVAVPHLEEQRLLLARVGAIDVRLRLEEQSLQKISAEKSGLMDDLLTGRIRVTPLLAAEQQGGT